MQDLMQELTACWGPGKSLENCLDLISPPCGITSARTNSTRGVDEVIKHLKCHGILQRSFWGLVMPYESLGSPKEALEILKECLMRKSVY